MKKVIDKRDPEFSLHQWGRAGGKERRDIDINHKQKKKRGRKNVNDLVSNIHIVF